MIYCGGSQKLQIYLAGAVTASELPWILTAITTADVVAARNGVTTGATAVDVCNAADGLIRHLEVYNADTVSATIYVRYNDNGTTRIIHQEAVVAGYTLIYDSNSGWAVTPSSSGSAHAAVTLDANADTLLSLSTQAIGLDTKAANLVFAGPTTGAAAVPAFRSLVSADIPALAYEASGAIATHAALITGVHGLVFTAGKALTLTESLTLNALPIGGLAVATGANVLGSLAVGLTTQVLVGGGAGTVPAWAADLPTAVTIGTGYIYRAGGTDVPVADGGTGVSTFALNGVLFGNAANAIGVTAIGAQYQVLTVGASPFVPVFSGFLLDGTTGGKTILAVTNTKTLTLTAADSYNLTIPATGTVVLRSVAMADDGFIGPSSTTGIYFKGGLVGIGTTGPAAKLSISTQAISLNIHLMKSASDSDTLDPRSATFAGSYLHLGGGEYGVDALRLITFGYHPQADASANPAAYMGYSDTSVSGITKGDLVFGTRDVVTDTLATERVRITSAGNVGIGTILAGAGVTYAKFNVNGGLLLVGADSTQESPLLAVTPSFVVSTHASYTSRTIFSQWAIGGAQEVMRMESGAAAMWGVFGAAAIVRPAALTTQLTTITHSAPGTPDYALQDLVQNTGFGFATKDEGNSALAALANLQTRMGELEDKLGHTAGLGLITH